MNKATLSWIWRAAVVVSVLAFAGLALAVLGLAPIGASSGHWAPTAWFLEFAKRRSVSTHTLGAREPASSKPWQSMQGAAHYETACRPCHGSPGFRDPVIARSMTPPPPYLAPRIETWEPEELFYIVKHGIKFTGMPAWPTLQRDDEVRGMVAFLRLLPDLDESAYRRLVQGAEPGRSESGWPEHPHGSAAPALVASCARCHGRSGEGRGNAAFPKLAGQKLEYLVHALEAYATGRRPSGIMQPVAAPLSAQERRELAGYYAALPAPEPEPAVIVSEALERGKQLATNGSRGQAVPSCVDCHGPRPEKRNPMYPSLAGQYADYLVLQLELFKSQTRGGSRYSRIMHNVASRLRPEQMREVAGYYASLPH